MKWLLAACSGFVCAILACVLAGWIASLCVEWYRISSFEGAAGYYVVFIALGGAVAGFALGVITTLLTSGRQDGFARGIGISIAATVGVAALALGFAWLLGDIPPTLHGDRLQLLVELQAPPGWKPSKKMLRGGYSIRLESISAVNAVRGTKYGQIDWSNATEQNGRAIVPASVFLFTGTGKRGLTATIEDTPAIHFQVPLPAHPGAEFEQWSDWLPENSEPGNHGGFRYRFRVMRFPLWQAAREEERKRKREALRAEMLAAPADAPLEFWLRFQILPNESDPMLMEEQARTLRDVFTKRVDELSPLLNHPNPEISRRALEALLSLDEIPASAETPLRDLAPRFAADLRELRNHPDPRNAGQTDAEEIFQSVQRWLEAWEHLLQDGKRSPPDVSAITAEAALWKDDAAVKPILIVLEDSLAHWKRIANGAP